ncbi:hypothetical protein [Herbidospora mongoliensis]|uniref:hypothetical protein n=1 Tax=Herbidospora mongoliensis TaxID=688067 RepID=UPI0012FCC05D|nr:hypothetical protein [Herbidospora mongoliensis]
MTTAPVLPEGAAPMPDRGGDRAWIARLRAIVRAGGPSAAAELGDLLTSARARLGASHSIALRIAAATEGELSRTRRVDDSVTAWAAVHAEAGVSLGPDDPVTMEIASGHLRWLARRARPDDLRRALTSQRAELARRRETLGPHDHWTGVARADLATTLLTLPLIEPENRRVLAEAADHAAEEAGRRAGVLGDDHMLTWEARALEASARLAVVQSSTGSGTVAEAAEHALAVAEACMSLGGPLDAGRQIRAALLTADAHLAADRPGDAERAARLAAGLFSVRPRPWWGGADPGRPWVVIARSGARADAAGHAARALTERSRWFPSDSLRCVEVTRLLHLFDGR